MTLVRLLGRYPDALRADLQRFYGLDLDELGVSASVAHFAACAGNLPDGSAVARAIDPERARWGVSEYLLAAIADSLRWLVWAKTKDAKKGRNRPKPIPRPGDGKKDRGTFKGVVSRPLDEVKRLLKLPRR